MMYVSLFSCVPLGLWPFLVHVSVMFLFYSVLVLLFLLLLRCSFPMMVWICLDVAYVGLQVVLPVVARKKGLDDHYERADGSPQPKRKQEVPIPPVCLSAVIYSVHKPELFWFSIRHLGHLATTLQKSVANAKVSKWTSLAGLNPQPTALRMSWNVSNLLSFLKGYQHQKMLRRRRYQLLMITFVLL